MRLYRRKRKDGKKGRVWWVRWGEEKKSTGCEDYAAAELVARQWERNRADPIHAATSAATFGLEAAGFLTECKAAVGRGQLATGTLSMYRQKAGTLVRILGSETLLASFDGDTFPAYILARKSEYREARKRELTDSSVYKEWVTFRQILKHAWRARRFDRDPSSLKPPHFGPNYSPQGFALSWDEVAALLYELPANRAAPVAFAIATGARRSAVFRAQPGDLDRETWMVRIRGTKTSSSARTIPVPSPFRRLLAGVEPPFDGWEHNTWRTLERACRRAGIAHTATWNDFRRTFATLLWEKGVPSHALAKLLGHTSTAMVELTYGKPGPEQIASLLEETLGD